MEVVNRARIVGIGIAALFLVSIFAVAGARGDDEEAGWIAHMNGANERPTPRDTPAHGVALIFMNDDGTLGFKILVANINNVVAAHIHCGSPDVAGPVGVTLFMGAAGQGRFNGVLVSGTKDAPDSGNACGWTDLAAVFAAIGGGDTYVNVHTNDGVAPPGTGPGDFPGGEIRGQLMPTD
ncbi:MAG TPA: CHRD domain-containing protein [Thermoplasmata archaeon]|nr:CHRD domain-containing protein [Thermoplasmata archaeon]